MIRRIVICSAGAVFAALLVPATAPAEEAEKTPPVEAAAPAEKAAPDCLRRKDMFSQEEIDAYEAAKAAATQDPQEFDRVKRSWRIKKTKTAEAMGKPLCSDLKQPANPCAANPCGGS